MYSRDRNSRSYFTVQEVAWRPDQQLAVTMDRGVGSLQDLIDSAAAQVRGFTFHFRAADGHVRAIVCMCFNHR